MSKLWVNQDFETDASPFTLSNTMSRSSTNPISGSWSLEGGDGVSAVAGLATYALPIPGVPSSGSRRGLRVQARWKLNIDVNNSGGAPSILTLTGQAASLIIQKLSTGGSANKLTAGIGSALGTGSTTLAVDTTYTFDLDYREERANGCRVRLYLNGALEIDLSTSAAALGRLSQISVGTDSTKVTWLYRWDEMKLWSVQDPG